MRRIIVLFILVLLCFFLIRFKIKKASLEKIDLKLNKDEIGIILYNSKQYGFLLEIDKLNTLYIFKYNKKINNLKNIFNIEKIDNIISNNEINNNIKIYNYNFCILKENIDINNCTFIYIKEEIPNVSFNNTNKVVFYDNSISDEYKENLYTKWLDVYELNDDNYTILKIKKDTYNILNIPL